MTRLRFPGLTLGVAAVTVAMLVVQESVPGTLGRLERTRAALHGDWWRWATALVVQDGHWVGGISNVVGLLVVGAAAEQVVPRRTWLAAYSGAGLAGQVFGQLWQPTGGGNSVAVCGLAALCVAVVVRSGHRAVPPLVVAAPVYWCGSIASGLWVPLLYAGVVVAILLTGPLERFGGVRWLVLGVAGLTAAALLGDTDIHGGALAVALVAALPLAEPLAPRPTQPVR